MDEIPDNSISLVVTSPPYFDAKDYGATGSSNIGDSSAELRAYERYLRLMENVYKECFKKLFWGGHIVVNVADVIINSVKYPVGMDTGKILQRVFPNGYLDTIIWKKPQGMSSQKRFGIFMQNPHPKYYRPNNMYEPMFVFVKGKKNYNFNKEANTLNWEKFKKYQSDIWEMQPETRKANIHPAPFPYELPKTFIELFTCRNEWVLDPFGGSGTTMKAARNLNRNSYLYELNEEYIEKAIKPELGILQGRKTKEGIVDLAGNIYIIKKQEIQPPSTPHSNLTSVEISEKKKEAEPEIKDDSWKEAFKIKDPDYDPFDTSNDEEESVVIEPVVVESTKKDYIEIEITEYVCRSCFERFKVKEGVVVETNRPFENTCVYCGGAISKHTTFVEKKWLNKEKEPPKPPKPRMIDIVDEITDLSQVS